MRRSRSPFESVPLGGAAPSTGHESGREVHSGGDLWAGRSGPGTLSRPPLGRGRIRRKPEPQDPVLRELVSRHGGTASGSALPSGNPLGLANQAIPISGYDASRVFRPPGGGGCRREIPGAAGSARARTDGSPRSPEGLRRENPQTADERGYDSCRNTRLGERR